ncbi:exo-beta-N-acetylmuramidase NamZ family protein [Winogradskyella pulchriflava]|uniref:Exo-beta-N-acetylmuramidase NamZ domain-containing protein n=1 Tax=Winogradskyella pulchriflava TaxID=1110688 RepID=A0ABV6QCD3_9FLAO
MRFKVFKNTVLLFVLVAISCGSKTKNDMSSNNEIPKQVQNDTTIQEDKKIIVGANRTKEYLPLLRGKRVGVVANQTSVIFIKDIPIKLEAPKSLSGQHKPLESTVTLNQHLVDSLLALNITIKKVFSPEHGFRGTADAGEDVKDGIDTKTQLPIFSLHGKHKKPTQQQLQDLDIVVFDIQDVGVRFYTYISTLHYVMEACAENNVPLLILDRPNPNGNYVDGPVLEKEHSSFLGMHPIPLVHGMTIGEYAKMINGEGWLKDGLTCNITIIENENYTHDSFYSLPIRPSPNLPNDQSIRLYPSLGLFEGTDVNAGRGTEFQFQRYGAPFLDQTHYTFNYTPQPNFGSKFPKHKDVVCYGVDLSNVQAKREFTLKYIIDAYNHATDKSKVFNTANFTKHAGTTKLQQQIESGLSEDEIRATWKADIDAYKKTRQNYLIYN